MKYYYQFDAIDCGPACIAMIASTYNIKANLEDIRINSETSYYGTTLQGLLKGAKSLGLDGKAIRIKNKCLKNKIIFPSIAYIKKNKKEKNFNHFVVIRKVINNKIEIWDPDFNKKKVKLRLSKFYELWSGILVLFEPSEEIKRERFKRISVINYLPKMRYSLSFLIIISFILFFLGVGLSYYFKFIVDQIIDGFSLRTVSIVSTCMLILVVIHASLEFLRRKTMVEVTLNSEFELFEKFFIHLEKLPMLFFMRRKRGDIISRIYDIQRLKDSISNIFIGGILDLGIILFIVPLLFFINYKLTLLIIPCFLLIFLTGYFFSFLQKRNYRKEVKINEELNSLQIEILDGIQTLKAFNNAETVHNKLYTKKKDSLNTQYKIQNADGMQNLILSIVHSFLLIFVFWIGSTDIFYSKMTIGNLIAYNSLLGYFLNPFLRMSQGLSLLQEFFISLRRVDCIFNIREEDNKNFLCPKDTNIDIEIKGLSFWYTSNNYILKNINLYIPYKKYIAFVGVSGSGKTTLAKILANFFMPVKGAVTFNDVNVNDIDTSWIRKNICYVSNTSTIFSTSILENITFKTDFKLTEKLYYMSKLTGFLEIVERFPEKFESRIGETGIELSTGEKQKLILTRVLMSDAKIVILDEPTSNMDSISERKFEEIINELRKNKTVIVLAQHLNTIKNAECIYVLNNGEIVEKGSHDELLNDKGFYFHLWESRF